MKTKLILLMGLLLTGRLYASDTGGIYKSVADYSGARLSYSVACTQGKFKVHLHDFFGNASSFSFTADKKYTLRKSEVFGFRDCDGNDYRFYKNVAYKIVDAGQIYVYAAERNVALARGFSVVVEYYFSKSADGDLYRLTADNLCSAFAANEQFVSKIKCMGGNVADYDNTHKMFKINYLYSNAQK